MLISIVRMLIEFAGISYVWMLPAFLLEVCIWVGCFIGYAIHLPEEK